MIGDGLVSISVKPAKNESKVVHTSLPVIYPTGVETRGRRILVKVETIKL
jgi:hypothetical protein